MCLVGPWQHLRHQRVVSSSVMRNVRLLLDRLIRSMYHTQFAYFQKKTGNHVTSSERIEHRKCKAVVSANCNTYLVSSS